jgi:hypothetical protein
LAAIPMNIFNYLRHLSERKKIRRYYFHNYAAEGAYKDKSILHKNAISLVISGERPYFADKTVYINDDEFHYHREIASFP